MGTLNVCGEQMMRAPDGVGGEDELGCTCSLSLTEQRGRVGPTLQVLPLTKAQQVVASKVRSRLQVRGRAASCSPRRCCRCCAGGGGGGGGHV